MKQFNIMTHTVVALVCIMVCTSTVLAQWNQMGSDVDGANAGDLQGWAVSLSADGLTLATGAIELDGNYQDIGGVYVFQWNGTTWTQKGSTIVGGPGFDYILSYYGAKVELSSDGNTIVIGAPEYSTVGASSGKVQVYQWNGVDWLQKGSDLDGQSTWEGFGHDVAINAAGDIIAVSSYERDGQSAAIGYVRFYQWNGNNWIQMGTDIYDPTEGTGASIDISDDGLRAVAGVPFGANFSYGTARIYEWDGNSWTQLGSDVITPQFVDHFGFALNMSSDGSIVAGSSYASSAVLAFQWNGSDWVQRGTEIFGSNIDLFGNSVSMNADGTVLVVGAPAFYAVNFPDNGDGYVRLFNWNGTDWIQNGTDILGTGSEDAFGYSAAINDEGTIIAAGAPYNNVNGALSGHVRVFTTVNLAIVENSFGYDLDYYPNPAKDALFVELGGNYKDIQVDIFNELGQIVSTQHFNSLDRVQIDLSGEPGVYFVKLKADQKSAVLRLIKE